MNKKKHVNILILLFIVLFISTNAVAGNLFVQGQLNGLYISDANIITMGSCIVKAGHSATLKACYSIILNPGFHAENGSTFTANINQNQSCDIDSDGLIDGWEFSYFGDLDEGPNGDYDGDGLTNLEEFQQGTDPTDPNDPPPDPCDQITATETEEYNLYIQLYNGWEAAVCPENEGMCTNNLGNTDLYETYAIFDINHHQTPGLKDTVVDATKWTWDKTVRSSTYIEGIADEDVEVNIVSISPDEIKFVFVNLAWNSQTPYGNRLLLTFWGTCNCP